MPETLALIRFAFSRNRLLLGVVTVAFAVGLITFAITMPEDPSSDHSAIAFAALCCALIPAAVATITLFDYGIESDLNHPASGCNHWVLRMPIHGWKIALVPVLIKTLWASGLWIVLFSALRALGTAQDLPIVPPCLAFSGTAIWLLAIGWRPFRSGWQRILALIIGAPLVYCVVVGSGSAPYIDRVEWRSTAIATSYVVAIAFYAAAVFAAIHSVALARVATYGLIPATQGLARRRSADTIRARDFQGQWRALISTDWLKSRRRIVMVVTAVALPTAAFLGLCLPLNIVTVVLAFTVFAYYGGAAAVQAGGPEDNPPSLEVYLAAAPIKTSKLAWSKSISTLGIVAFVYANILWVFAGWACWSTNRVIWMQWAEDLPAATGTSGDSFWMGVRISLAILLAWTVFFLSRIACYSWIGMTGRRWFGLMMTCLSVALFLVPFGIVLAWFITQTSWESTRESALSYLSWAPWIVAVWLAAKALATIAVGWEAWRRQLLSAGELWTVVGLWSALVLSTSAILTGLISDPRVGFLWCVSLTAAAVPIARVLLCPLALAWNRHR